MTLVLPTLPEFEALSLPDREALFIAWVKEQPPEKVYDYVDIKACPLSRFGTLIVGDNSAHITGGTCTFSAGGVWHYRRIDVLERHGKTSNRLFTHNTFGDLAASLS